MPIYEQSYRRWEARGPLREARFLPITREALRLILSRRAFLLLLIAAWIPFIVDMVRLYIVSRYPQARSLGEINPQFFGAFLNRQLGFVTLISIFGGAGLIANDLRTGGILVYLSRPLTRRDYVLGKIGVPVALNLAVTLVPCLVLYAAATSLAPDLLLKWNLLWVAPVIVLHSLVIAVGVGLLVLAVSSVSRSARVTGVALIALWVGLETLRLIANNAFGRPELALLSLQADVQAVGNALFGIRDQQLTLFWAWPALALLAACLGCLAVLRSRVRAVEVVR
jgi:ABC-2 type transport system permease protein